MHLAIIGLPGIGKSSLARALHRHLGGEIFLEDPEDHPFVEDAFRDARRWSCTNQLEFITSKLSEQVRMRGLEDLVIQEMDAYAAHHTWTWALLECGLISERELGLIESVFDFVSAEVRLSVPDMALVIEGPPELALERVQQRNRGFEVGGREMEQLIRAVQKRLEAFPSAAPWPVASLAARRLRLGPGEGGEREAVEAVVRLVPGLR